MDVVLSGRIVDNFLMYPKSSDTYGDVWIDDGYEGFGLFDRLENEISGKPGVKTDWTVKNRIGQYVTVLKEASLELYFTKEPCTLKECESLVAETYSGELRMELELRGYAQYKMLGYDICRCMLDEHKLVAIIDDHQGDYILFHLSWDENV